MDEQYDCLYRYGRVTAQGTDRLCPSYGMPLPERPAASGKMASQRLFMAGFIVPVVFCLFLIVWLPR